MSLEEIDKLLDDTEIELSFEEVLRFDLTEDSYLETYIDSDKYVYCYVTETGDEKTIEFNYSEPFSNLVTISKEHLDKVNEVKLNYIKEINNG